MADRTPPDPALITEVLRFAIAAAGDMDDITKWHGRLSVLIPEIVTVLGEGSREHEQVTRMMNCPILTGEFLGYRLHDGNHRAEVTFQVNDREPENVWSERTDTQLGASQLKILKSLPKGCRVRVWKDTRQIDQTKKVRDMLHIQRIDADPLESPRPEGSALPPAERSTSGPAESPTEPTRENGSVGQYSNTTGEYSNTTGQQSNVVLDYVGALERLRLPDRVKLARWAHQAHGITSLYDENLTVEQKNRVLAQCELIAQGMV